MSTSGRKVIVEVKKIRDFRSDDNPNAWLARLPGPNFLEERDDFAAAIGRIVARWNWIEAKMLNLLMVLDGRNPHEVAQSTYEIDDWGNVRTREMKDVTQQIREAVTQGSPAYDYIVDIEACIEEFYQHRRTRNVLVHGLWTDARGEPEKLRLWKDRPHYAHVRAEQIRWPARLVDPATREERTDWASRMQKLAEASYIALDAQQLSDIDEAFKEYTRFLDALTQEIRRALGIKDIPVIEGVRRNQDPK